jgi:hypothetical protein
MKGNRTRAFAVTGGLLLAGAICGSVAALTGFSIVSLLVWRVAPPLIAWFVVAAGGAILGAPLLPATGWLLMRRVPLWLSFVGTTAGAVIGGVLGALVSRTSPTASTGRSARPRHFCARSWGSSRR